MHLVNMVNSVSRGHDSWPRGQGFKICCHTFLCDNLTEDILSKAIGFLHIIRTSRGEAPYWTRSEQVNTGKEHDYMWQFDWKYIDTCVICIPPQFLVPSGNLGS